ncbi:M56 family metallopeptidase [Pedobacter sp. V48]|uniref:M56 family metallopeptidase n=1 Tax=Pedobacter sp. V48 TaxID=509635 RepID=UPI0003E579C5|nr:M56 family metallopeptidase [Pedobacter sp. V48]ETZ20459.1 hypothetical protein N824_05620 [Pedobacter sp. V48]
MEAIVNNLIKATGWSIFHSLWQGAIIYGILVAVTSAFPKIDAKIKHNLAYGALCLIFLGFCITFFSLFKLPVNSVVTASDQISNVQQSDYLVRLPQDMSSITENFFPYLVSIYTIGILFQLLILGIGYKKLLDLKWADRTPVPTLWLPVFESMVAKLNLRQNIEFYLSSRVNVPLVIGYLKPVVLFPIALASQLDIKQVEAILIHELSHIRRNDYLLNLIKTGIETILFFNPFVWLGGRLINIEREHACDDLVLKFTGSPLTYAHALLKLEILKNKSTPALSMAATGNDQHLYQRIKRITDMKTNYMNAKQQILAITLTIATIISLAWISPAKKAPVVKKEDQHSKKVDIEGLAIKSKIQTLLAPVANEDCDNDLVKTDTTKKKNKFKIVTLDAKGNKKEYNSLKEMPDSLRQEVVNESFMNDFKFDYKFNLDSVTKVSMAYIKSPEFQQQIKEVQKNAVEMAKHFNSPEWKKQQAEMKKNMDLMREKINSPEFKKRIEEMKELQNSPEYKELKRKFDNGIDSIKKKKGIKTDIDLN